MVHRHEALRTALVLEERRAAPAHRAAGAVRAARGGPRGRDGRGARARGQPRGRHALRPRARAAPARARSCGWAPTTTSSSSPCTTSSRTAGPWASWLASSRGCTPRPAPAGPLALPPLPVQYGDYAVWQRGRIAGAEMAAQLAYWRERLAGADAGAEPSPPTGRVRPSRASRGSGCGRGGRRGHRRAARLGPPGGRHALHDAARRVPAPPRPLRRPGRRAGRLAHRRAEPDRARRAHRLLREHARAPRAISAGTRPSASCSAAPAKRPSGPSRTTSCPSSGWSRPSGPSAIRAGTRSSRRCSRSRTRRARRSPSPGVRSPPSAFEPGSAKVDLSLALTETADGLRGSLEYCTRPLRARRRSRGWSATWAGCSRRSSAIPTGRSPGCPSSATPSGGRSSWSGTPRAPTTPPTGRCPRCSRRRPRARPPRWR